MLIRVKLIRDCGQHIDPKPIHLIRVGLNANDWCVYTFCQLDQQWAQDSLIKDVNKQREFRCHLTTGGRSGTPLQPVMKREAKHSILDSIPYFQTRGREEMERRVSEYLCGVYVCCVGKRHSMGRYLQQQKYTLS